jgi:hypothetical protein
MEEFPKNLPENEASLMEKTRESLMKEIGGWYKRELVELAKNIGVMAHDEIVVDIDKLMERFKQDFKSRTTPTDLQLVETQVRLIKERETTEKEKRKLSFDKLFKK